MKTISIFLFIILISCMGIKAQKPILVLEDSINFGKTLIPGLTVIIPESNYEKTLKVWIKDLQSSTKSKLVTENNEMSIFGARLKEVSPNPLNVYSKLMNLDSMLKLTVAFEVKKNQYIERSTGETEFTNAKNFLKEFARNQYLDIAKDQADAEDKKLRELEKELSSLEKEKTRLQKSIQSDNSNIITEKGNITIQNNELTTVSSELVDQNNKLSSMEEGQAKKEKINYINGLEKRRKKAQNSMESSENRINKANNEIDKANVEIPKNERMQAEVNEKIEKQQAVCQKFADKLKTIKTY